MDMKKCDQFGIKIFNYDFTIKLLIGLMTDRYAELFKQLYERRLINVEEPMSSFDRVKIIQRKMNQNIERQSKINLSLKFTDNPPFLQEPDSVNPKRIIRQTFNNVKIKPNRKLSLPSRKESRESINCELDKQTVKCITSYLHKNRSLTQREKAHISYPTGLYHTKKYQMVRRDIPLTSQMSNRSNKSLYLKRSTPSRNVLIAGCNLEQEAEIHRKQFKELEVQIQKYNTELKLKESQASKTLTERIKISRYERQNNFNLRKQNIMIKQTKQIVKRLESSRVREKQQVTPWAVLVPQYQYY